ncbi:hypothetical protein XENTR_v10016840 [Xenopus tropicalis]|nr:hypothetical protein XENTR_v10016840 [Xenopus tropicalis]
MARFYSKKGCKHARKTPCKNNTVDINEFCTEKNIEKSPLADEFYKCLQFCEFSHSIGTFLAKREYVLLVLQFTLGSSPASVPGGLIFTLLYTSQFITRLKIAVNHQGRPLMTKPQAFP